MTHRRAGPPFAPTRVFCSRYPKVTITYRDGRPWSRSTTSHGGRYQKDELLVAVSAEDLIASLQRAEPIESRDDRFRRLMPICCLF